MPDKIAEHFHLLARGGDRVILVSQGRQRTGSDTEGGCADQRQRLSTLGELGREHERDRATLALADQVDRIESLGVHHRQRVMHPLVQRRSVRDAVGQAGATLVDHHHLVVLTAMPEGASPFL